MSDYLSADKKQEIFSKYGKSNVDTGSPESQVALFSWLINYTNGCNLIMQNQLLQNVVF